MEGICIQSFVIGYGDGRGSARGSADETPEIHWPGGVDGFLSSVCHVGCQLLILPHLPQFKNLSSASCQIHLRQDVEILLKWQEVPFLNLFFIKVTLSIIYHLTESKWYVCFHLGIISVTKPTFLRSFAGFCFRSNAMWHREQSTIQYLANKVDIKIIILGLRARR